MPPAPKTPPMRKKCTNNPYIKKKRIAGYMFADDSTSSELVRALGDPEKTSRATIGVASNCINVSVVINNHAKGSKTGGKSATKQGEIL